MRAPAPPLPQASVERAGALSSSLALIGVALALLSSAQRVVESAAVRGSDGGIAVLFVAGALVGLVAAWLRGGRPTLPIGAGALIAAALVMGSVPELPPFPTIESFGRSAWFVLVLCALLVGATQAAALRASTLGGHLADGLLLLFVVFSGFAGPMFVRDANEFHRAFLLLAVVGLLALPWRAGRVRDVPFLLPFLAFLATGVAAAWSAVDLDRHLAGLTRAAAAGLPLLVLGLGPPDPARARRALSAFAAVVLAGGVCAGIALLEAGWHFSLRHAAGARLPLFGAHPNIIAPYFSVAPPLLLALLAAARGKVERSWLLLALALAVAALGLTRSRAAIAGGALSIGAFVGLYALVALHRRRPARSTAVALTLGAILLVAGGGYALRGPIADKFADASMQFRVHMWKAAAAAIEDRPLAGFGFLTSAPLTAYSEPSDLDGRSKETHPHALPLAIALGAGLPALVAFLLLLGVFTARTLAAAARLARAEDRALAVAAVASALALLASNLLDQGLSLNTPFPLHLGLVLGVGALCVRLARNEREARPAAAPSPVGRGAAVLARALAMGIFVITACGLVAQRVTDRALNVLAATDRARAIAWLDLAQRLNPWSLQLGLQRAALLDEAGRRTDALAALQEVADTHPLSWQPWERISVLEMDRREELRALLAVKNAQKRDPTGPLTGEWGLRAARLHLGLRQRDSALTELSRALLTDYHAAARVPWKKDETGALHLPAPKGLEPIHLTTILARNTERMIELSASDPVKARRVATTLVRICITFRMVDLGRSVVREFESRNPPWISMEVAKADLERLAGRIEEAAVPAAADPATGNESPAPPDGDALAETQQTQPIEDSAPAAAAAAPPPGTGETGPTLGEGDGALPPPVLGVDAEVAGDYGASGMFYARAYDHLAAGRVEDAVAAARQGIGAIYDMVAEREYLRILVDIAFQGSSRLADPKEARRWFRPALYFNPVPRHRLDRYRLLAHTELTAGELRRAHALLKDALPLFERLQPDARDAQALARFALTWSHLQSLSDPIADKTSALLDRQPRTGPHLLLRIGVALDQKQREEAQSLLQELRRTAPLWTVEAAKR